ncbi:nucleotidyltransferase family protein [Jannaschia sp. R86511]|uniref:nucleotidyltransferase family protein n=1 Tax=Jannaschia sp. R86511 TaxID=3093853 RepID=UPI0036D39D1F
MTSASPVSAAGLAALVRPGLGLPPRGHAGHGGPTPGTDGGEADPIDLVEAARRHGVVGLLPTDGRLAGPVRAARRETLAHYVRTLHDLRTIRDAFAVADVDWVLVKGAALAHELYPRPDVRPFADADVVVAPGRLAAALDALEAVGAVDLVHNWDLMLRLGLAEITLVMPAGTQVDLHWSLANRASVRDGLGFRTDALLAGSRPCGLLPGLRTPDDVDALVHVAWHCARNGAARLLWLCDVELAAARVLDRHEALQDALARTGTLLPVAVALDRAAQVFPGGAAQTVADRLPQGWWRALNRASGRRLVGAPPGRRSGRALVRASGRDGWRSLTALRVPGLHLGPTPAQESLSADRGGTAGRGAYLAWVQAHGH